MSETPRPHDAAERRGAPSLLVTDRKGVEMAIVDEPAPRGATRDLGYDVDGRRFGDYGGNIDTRNFAENLLDRRGNAASVPRRILAVDADQCGAECDQGLAAFGDAANEVGSDTIR
jgi:hypothetical protein